MTIGVTRVEYEHFLAHKAVAHKAASGASSIVVTYTAFSVDSSMSKVWVIDLGTSMHFMEIHLVFPPWHLVHLDMYVQQRVSPIKGKVDIQLSPNSSIFISNGLHTPCFPKNLLSISSLLKT